MRLKQEGMRFAGMTPPPFLFPVLPLLFADWLRSGRVEGKEAVGIVRTTVTKEAEMTLCVCVGGNAERGRWGWRNFLRAHVYGVVAVVGWVICRIDGRREFIFPFKQATSLLCSV